MTAASDKFERERFYGRMVGMFEAPEVAAYRQGYTQGRLIVPTTSTAQEAWALSKLQNPFSAHTQPDQWLSWASGFALRIQETWSRPKGLTVYRPSKPVTRYPPV